MFYTYLGVTKIRITKKKVSYFKIVDFSGTKVFRSCLFMTPEIGTNLILRFSRPQFPQRK